MFYLKILAGMILYTIFILLVGCEMNQNIQPIVEQEIDMSPSVNITTSFARSDAAVDSNQIQPSLPSDMSSSLPSDMSSMVLDMKLSMMNDASLLSIPDQIIDPPVIMDAMVPTECTEQNLGELYNTYIEPFVSGQVPSSCSQCHMTGIDISLYAQDTACDTMACMIDHGAVNLEDPASSAILTQIAMGNAASSVFSVETERIAMETWINWSSLCHGWVCGEIESGCSQGTGALTTGILPQGSCSEDELLASFWDCYGCVTNPPVY